MAYIILESHIFLVFSLVPSLILRAWPGVLHLSRYQERVPGNQARSSFLPCFENFFGSLYSDGDGFC
jgi:hypothetical protein